MGSTLVVGYDGSDEARAALAYAAEHVDGGRIFIVSAADRVPDYQLADRPVVVIPTGKES
jgi:nucleotide-binding universal stress UspA family protein